jgi:hypothetical protein
MKKLLATLIMIAGTQVFAQQFPLTGGAFDIAPGQVQSVRLNRKSAIETIYVQAQCFGNGSSRLEVQKEIL